MKRAAYPGMSSTQSRFAIVVAWPIGLLLVAVSIGGLVSPAYARETPIWSAQAVGQDWFDLLIAVPWLAFCAAAARRGAYRSSILLAGAYAYIAYEMVIYAFSIHFNSLFLVYCAVLGLSSYALITLAIDLGRRVEPVDRGGARLAGGFLVVLGSVFASMWLAEDVPALLHAVPPKTLVDNGLFTNPVHIIDLSFVLPAHVVAGVLVWKGRSAGQLLAPIVLAFGVMMAASIGGMMLVIHLTGGEAAPFVTIAMFVVAAITLLVLVRLLRRRPAELLAPA
jgi:hypothetical protein